MTTTDITKKKVLYVITKSNWGGAQRYVYDLATNLPLDEFEVAVILGGEGKLKEKLEHKNIRVISVERLRRDVRFFDEFYVFFKLLKIFRTEKPDVIHLNSSKIGGLGTLAGRLARVPKIIFTAHGWSFNENRPVWQKFTMKFVSWITVMFSHFTITVSKKDFSDSPQFIIKNRVFFIHNGIANQAIEDPAIAKKILSDGKLMPTSDIIVGMVAELHKNKGISYAIKSMRGLLDNGVNASLVIIGEGEERKKIEELVAMKNLEKRVFLLGGMVDAGKLLRAFDIFLLSSVKEGLPYVLLEAGLAGLPVIATSVGGTPEIIENMKSGILVPPKNPEALAGAIKFMINNPEKRKEFGERLKEKIEKNFRLETMVEKTLGIYSENLS